ncbi:hypothetical protein PHLCEN_2v10787 [Hermanssonia centrifuga]|uniref:Chalcone synthase n=1 Tax=Hermanssonia centrifuga TaxID=98765 RepID=A0A2R6NM78_9APHY|nr:hypothetical protein PHLCEN_2v10787 [Hermanssonia centrifuga]
MSPHKVLAEAAQQSFPEVDLHIMGVGSQYPEHTVSPQEFREFALRHYPRTPALEKVLAINENTGIDVRSAACSVNHPMLNQPHAPTIDQLSEIFLTEGVKLAVGASRKAIEEWGGDISQITHVVATTCTNSANPGYDYYVARELGLSGSVERTLLHGVGCAGGLAVLRNAANIALGASFLGRPARILVVTCELASLMARSELDSLNQDQDLRIGMTIFSDGSSAVVLSNGIGESPESKPVFDLLAWDHRTLPETDKDIGFDVHPNGWKVILTPRVPALASTSAPPLLNSLLPRIPSLADRAIPLAPQDFDWALHPGGAKVLTSVQKLLGLTPHHLRASYDVYKNHGNSSGATIFSVLNRLRDMGEGREHVVGCAFGPGVAIEMCVLRRHRVPSEVQAAPASGSSSDSE